MTVQENKEKKTRKPKPRFDVVDLFCGIGGLSYGLKTAGFHILAGYDLDWTCQYAYETNTGGKFNYRDVNSITGDEINKLYSKRKNTSDNTKTAWGAMVEIGASWITRVDHKIFNINGFRPEHPLNDEAMWNTIRRADDGRLTITKLNCDDFCSKIEQVCEIIGYTHQNRDDNKAKLSTLIVVE